MILGSRDYIDTMQTSSVKCRFSVRWLKFPGGLYSFKVTFEHALVTIKQLLTCVVLNNSELSIHAAYIFHTYIRFLWFKLYQFIPSNLSAPPVPYFQKYPIFKQSHFDIFNSRYIYIHFPAKYYQISLRFVYIILTYSRILKSL